MNGDIPGFPDGFGDDHGAFDGLEDEHGLGDEALGGADSGDLGGVGYDDHGLGDGMGGDHLTDAGYDDHGPAEVDPTGVDTGDDGSYEAAGTDHADYSYDDGGDGVERFADPTGAGPWDDPADSFPPVLDLDVTPADGQDWVDPDLLGGPGTGVSPFAPVDPPEALLSDLYQADGGADTPSWDEVSASDDPAIRALAAFWR